MMNKLDTSLIILIVYDINFQLLQIILNLLLLPIHFLFLINILLNLKIFSL